MGMRRTARQHDTVAVRRQAAVSEDYAEHSQGDRVITIDGPGRVIAVNDGPYPGAEEYEIRLEGGLGGGTYDAGQIVASAPVQASVGQSEAVERHTADLDYPELGTILHDRPDPAHLHYTATLEHQDGPDGGLSLTPAAPVVDDDGEGQVMRDMSQYHSSPAGDWSLASRQAARAFDHYHPDQVYLRFGGWPDDERSSNNVTGFKEDGVSVYDLDHEGEPMDPDPDLNRGHEHDEGCEPDCDLDSWNDDYGNDAGQEMRDRADRSERARRRGVSSDHPDVGHLVKGDMVGIGHDGEPLLNNVRRVGDWIDHRHLFVPGAPKHPLARDEDDEDYEPPEEHPGHQRTARSINGEHIDDHGSAPGWHRAANPNEYDRQSTEGEPDPAWIEDARERQQAMASSLPSITAETGHENLGPSPEDAERLRQHMITDHGYTEDQIGGLPDNGQDHPLHMEHELEHNTDTASPGVGGGDFGRGEEMGVDHVHRPHEPEQRSGYAPFPELPQSYHPAWGGSAAPDPAERLLNSVPAEADTELPLHALSMLATAVQDPGFRFHVTAAWRDVQAKAKRIRSQGGVSIKHSDGMTVVADVKGDHNVYETALQRAPGRRQSVAVYACGCKWGAYHWGASDDLSRFAGRMCSHALALQYEAASRGMFGRDVEVDDARPRWVPSKVVVKYDIDTGQHLRATASVVPEQPPILVALASMRDDDPAAHVITAAVNDMFGDTSGYTEPSLMSPMGPTAPWNPDESPASAGPLSGGEPYNWGRINGPTMLPRIASVITTEAFWQAIVPLVRAVAPKLIKSVAPAVVNHEVKEHQAAPPQETQVPDGTEYGSEAMLHDEPEGALPETDGERTASLGDVDIAESHSVQDLADDALSPESPSIMTHGAADIVAEFQRSAAAKTLMDGGPKGDTSNADIAQAAEAYLAKTAASSFTRAEQDALINESPGVQASNTDRLDIEGTHYAEIQDREDEGGGDDGWWMF